MENRQVRLEAKLVANITGTFYVPSYQRGYRWGKDEVLRLLNDIYDNKDNKDEGYCLQPVVVRKNGDSYELIDGQQRLTTLYLIYRFMKNANPMYYDDPSFSLEHQTRVNSGKYLRSIDLSQRKENIDFWFIADAYETIARWFEKDLRTRMRHIEEQLDERVRIIWYEVGKDEDAISLFTRLNIGKIPLTSAELVKAMFLCSYDKDRMTQEKRVEIALQWDNIERELNDDSFWYFLTNHATDAYQTRIDLVLDLIAEKPMDNRDNYYTYFKLDSQTRDEDGKKQRELTDKLWGRIQQTFLTLKDWHENHELYHKIGFLIASQKMTLLDVFKEAKGRTKREFKAALDGHICDSVAIKENYADLSYDRDNDYQAISTLLLLFNVESVRQNGEQTEWFPFNKLKFSRNGRVFWSLEHIHAQQSESLRTQEAWRKWLELHIPSVLNVAGNTELADAMRTAAESDKLERADFEKLQQRAVGLLSVAGNTEYLHSISNLALISASDNAALNNSTFDVKRNQVIEMDKEGQFIPFCTKMVFLKYYTPSVDNQLHFWGQADRVAYVKAMNRVLAKYLKEPIAIAEEA